MKTVQEVVQQIHADGPPVSSKALMDLNFALWVELPDQVRFGTRETGPCSIPFASSPQATAVYDLIRSRPDVAADVYALYYRGLCGDESIVAACRQLAFDPAAKSRVLSTMALCSLGTPEAVDALREIVRADECRQFRTSTAYALVWHYDDWGAAAIEEHRASGPLIDRLFDELCLATFGWRESCDRLLPLLDESSSSEIRTRLLASGSAVLVLRRRAPLEPEVLREWLEKRRTAGKG